MTLTTLITEIQTLLADDGTLFTAELMTQAARQTLRAMNAVSQHRQTATFTLTAAGREIALDALPQTTVQVERVWLPCHADDAQPNWRNFEQWPAAADEVARIYISDGPLPAAGEIALLWYATPHTLSGLDGATETTLTNPSTSSGLMAALVSGTAAVCIETRIRATSETFKIDPHMLQHLAALRDRHAARFDAWLACHHKRAAGEFVTWN
jgi:hypothetical protein